jgi:hypothetical protein
MNTLISNQVSLLTITAKAAIDVLYPFVKGFYALATLFAIVVIAIAAIIYYVFEGVNQTEPVTEIMTAVETVLIEKTDDLSIAPTPIIEPILSVQSVDDQPIPKSVTVVYEPIAVDNLAELTLESLKSIARSNKVKGWNMYKKPEKLADKLREVMAA